MTPEQSSRDELRDKRFRMQSEIAALEAAHDGVIRDGRYIDGPEWTDGERERIANLRRGLAKIDAAEEELEAPERARKAAILAERATNPRNLEPAYEARPMTSPAIAARHRITQTEPHEARAARDAALRAIDAHEYRLDADAADRLNDVVRAPNTLPEARYIAAVADPMYFRAFTKVLRAPDGAYPKLFMTAEEEEAWDAVNRARSEQRAAALAIGAGSTGGYALPFDLDPTLTNTASGANCPLRKLARVQVLTQNSRHFVNAAGVTAVYQAEGAAMSEAGPTFSQPTLTAARGSAFITASFEMFMDDEALVTDMANLIADGRDTLDATKFLTGSGTNEPLGIATIGTTGALTDTQRIQTASADAVVAADVYSTWNAIPPRYLAATEWVMSPGTYSYLYRTTPSGSETEPQLIPVFGGPMLGRPAHLWSTMDDAAASGEQTDNIVLIGGDWKNAVTIGDRLGMSIEIVPHMLNGATPSFPTGERGILGWWRTGVVVHNVNALRFLEVK